VDRVSPSGTVVSVRPKRRTAFLDAGFHVAARGFGIGRLVEPRPAPAEPVGLIGLVGLARFKFLFQQWPTKAHGMFGSPIAASITPFDQPRWRRLR
jgi:phosphoglycerol transferase MdoB-like AlkP superfamily enzyme